MNTTKTNLRQLSVVAVVYVVYVVGVAAANLLMRQTSLTGDQTYEMIAGIFFVTALPLLSVILPIVFAKRWKLQYSFWPQTKSVWLVLGILALYLVIVSRNSFAVVLTSGIPFRDFAVHFLSTTLFHVPYYPLFVMFAFPVLRKNFGLFLGLLLTGLAFGLYHLSHFYVFPEGTTLEMQVFLTLDFVVVLLLYLWDESVIIMALLHCIGASVEMASMGTLFLEVDFVFFAAILISGGTLAYMALKAIRHSMDQPYDQGWWLQTAIRR